MDVIYQAKRDDSARSGPHSPVQKTPIARYTPPISPLRGSLSLRSGCGGGGGGGGGVRARPTASAVAAPSPPAPPRPPSPPHAARAAAPRSPVAAHDRTVGVRVRGREERDEADADAKSIRSGAQPSFFRRLLCCRSSRAVSTDPGTLDEIELGGPSYVSDPNALLPPLLPEDTGKKCLVLDLDETLVHSSFKPVPNADFVIPVEINGIVHQVHVLKRPGVDRFLKFCAKYFEVVVFTASLSKYADPLLDLLDPNGVFRARLFREACDVHDGLLVKDLARLGRDMGSVIIIDNSPVSYMLQPENALPIASFFDDPNDRELDALLPYLKRLVHVENVYRFLEKINIDRGESTEYDPSTY